MGSYQKSFGPSQQIELPTFEVVMTASDVGTRIQARSSTQGEVEESAYPSDTRACPDFHSIQSRPTSSDDLRNYGIALFRLLFVPRVKTAWDRALGDALGRGLVLRLRLIAESPALSALPWELLYDEERKSFLAASSQIAFSRGLSVLEPVRDLRMPERPAILALLPSNSGLRTEAERQALEAAGKERHPIDLTVLDDVVTMRAVRSVLRKRQYQIVHFAGHAALREDGPIVFLDRDNSLPDRVKADRFAQLISDHPSIRLVVLNACHGAAQGSAPGLLGIGPRLLQRGLPAVLGMQGPIGDRDAGRFASEFYSELFSGPHRGQVELAAARARSALLQEGTHDPVFANPVLYLRARDGRLWRGESEAGANEATTVDRRREAPFMVPFMRNSSFVGRDEDLQRLHEALMAGDSPLGIRPTGLVGLGGIGKTQLAVEYAHRHRQAFPGGVFWINAAKPLLQELVHLAIVQGAATRDSDQETAASAAWRYLEARPDSLVVFDNVEDPSELNRLLLPGVVPSALSGKILFTTRRRSLSANFGSFDITVLPELPAMELLLRARPDALRESHPEWGVARVVCASLGRLPLALELAASYLAQYPELKLGDYLERLRGEGNLPTVDETDLQSADLPTRHDAAVAATLETQWNVIEDAPARLLLLAAGQFPEAERIPIGRLELLTGLSDQAPPGRPSSIRVSLRRLRNISLIEELREDHVRLHPLVQEFTALRAPSNLPLQLADRLLSSLRSFQTLEAQVGKRGIQVVLDDVRVGLRLLRDPKETPTRELTILERLLDRESHNLDRWDCEGNPSQFAQQIALRGSTLPAHEWRRSAIERLEELSQPRLDLGWSHGPESPGLVRTLVDRERSVALAISPRDDYFVSASPTGSIKIWDLPTGQLRRMLCASSGNLRVVTCGPDGASFLSGGDDAAIKQWDSRTGQLVRSLDGHQGWIQDIIVTPDNNRVISISKDLTIKIWDYRTGRILKDIQSDAWVRSVALDWINRRILCVCEDHQFRAWNLDSGLSVPLSLEGSTPRDLVQMIPKTSRIVLDAANCLVEVWDLDSKQRIQAVPGRRWIGAGSSALTVDGRYALLAGCELHIPVIDLFEGRFVGEFRGHNEWVTGIAISSSSGLVVSCSNDSTIKMWDLASILRHVEDSPQASSWASQSRRTDGVKGPAKTSESRVHRESVRALTVHADKTVASGSDDGSIQFWDAQQGDWLRSRHVGGKIDDLRFEDDGKLFGILHGFETGLWKLRSEPEFLWLKGPSAPWGVDSDGSHTVALGTSDDAHPVHGPGGVRRRRTCVQIWNLDNGEPTASWPVDLETDEALVLLPKGERVVAGESSVVMLDKDTGKTIARRSCSTGESVGALAALAGGAQLLAALYDVDSSIPSFRGKLAVWDGESLATIREFGNHTGRVTSMRVSCDEKRIYLATTERDLTVWELETGNLVTRVRSDGMVNCMAVSSDGSLVWVGDSIGHVRLFRLRFPHSTS